MVVAAVVGGLVLVGIHDRQLAAPVGTPEPAARSGPTRWSSPTTRLAVVIGVIYLNQVLFTIYVLREHGGDPGFISRHVPEGWFSLADGPLVDTLARNFPNPELLAPSVLRVNAVLELPFVVLAYLTVCQWCAPWVYDRATRLVWPMSLSYTATFCLIELRFRNPYTVEDIALRVLVGVLVPLWVARMPRRASPGRSDTLPGVLAFVASAGGLGLLCLVVYDTALLYNLGHLDRQLPVAVAALVAVGSARRMATRLVARRPSGRGVHSIAQSTGWLLVLAAVPALPIRYGIGFGARGIAAIGALVLVVAAAVRGAREAFARVPGRPSQWWLQMSASAVAGACGAATSLLVDANHPETRMLLAGTAALLAAISTCAYLDHRDTRRPAQAPLTTDTRRSHGGHRVETPHDLRRTTPTPPCRPPGGAP